MSLKLLNLGLGVVLPFLKVLILFEGSLKVNWKVGLNNLSNGFSERGLYKEGELVRGGRQAKVFNVSRGECTC